MTTVADNAWLAVTALPSDGKTAGTAALAQAIPPQIFYTQVTTCSDLSTAGATGTLSAAAGVSLPANPILYPKASYKISCAAGQGTCIVWPANATGGTTDTIDGVQTDGAAAHGIAAVLPGQQKEYAAMKNASGVITWVTIGQLDFGKTPAKTLTGTANSAPVLLAAESGLLLNLVGGNRANTITLPAAAAGLRFKFVYGSAAAAGGFDWKVAGAAATLLGGNYMTTSGAAGACVFAVTTVAGANSTSVAFAHAAAGARIGDFIDVVCNDGTNWCVFGMAGGTTAGFAFA